MILCVLTQCDYSTDYDAWMDEAAGEHSTRKHMVDQMGGTYLPLKSVYDRLYETYRQNAVTIKENQAKMAGITEENVEAKELIKRKNKELALQNAALEMRMDGIEDIAARAYFINHLREYGINVQDAHIEQQIKDLLSEKNEKCGS